MDTTIVAFKQALYNRSLADNKKLIFYLDRWIQYASKDFVYILTKSNQITQSMSRKGNSHDNAVVESFFKTIKTELINQSMTISKISMIVVEDILHLEI